MRIFAIKNEYENINEEVAYLLYYEKEKTFFIEIKEDIDPLKLPYICYHFRMKNILLIHIGQKNGLMKELFHVIDKILV